MIPALSTLYYLAMRGVRKALFPVAIPKRIRRFIPALGANCGNASASGAASLYDHYLSPLESDWCTGKNILEIGIGETNGSCYGLAARGAHHCFAMEPFVSFDHDLDQRWLAACAGRAQQSPSVLAEKVTRITGFAKVEAGSVDLALSNSVLEHVTDLHALAAELRRVLRTGAHMLHVVDYRDHFFTFPYHHLLWSDRKWRWFLDPGDLPRWRLGDHVRAFEANGFAVKIVLAKPIPDEFEKVRTRIHPTFQKYSEQDLATAFGVLSATAI